MGVGSQHHTSAALPPGKTRYPLYKRLGRPPRAGLDVCYERLTDTNSPIRLSHRMMQGYTVQKKEQALTKTISLATDCSVTPMTAWYIDSMTANITFTARLKMSSRRMVMEYILRNRPPPPPAVVRALFLQQATLAVRIWHQHLQSKRELIVRLTFWRRIFFFKF